MEQYTTDYYQEYTGQTERLHVEPIATFAERRHVAAYLPTWAMLALLVMVLIMVLARLPNDAPMAAPSSPAISNSYNRTCVLVVECR